MLKTLKAELYKLLHSRYIWVVAAAELAMTSVMIYDVQMRETVSGFQHAIRYMSYLAFFAGIIAGMTVGDDFDTRTYQHYLTGGRGRITFAASKLIICDLANLFVLGLPLLVYGVIDIYNGSLHDFSKPFWQVGIATIFAIIALSSVMVFIGFAVKNMGKTIIGSIVFVIFCLGFTGAGGAGFQIASAKVIPVLQPLFIATDIFEYSVSVMILVDILWIIAAVCGIAAVFKKADLK
jgi:hypothetical protein